MKRTLLVMLLAALVSFAIASNSLAQEQAPQDEELQGEELRDEVAEILNTPVTGETSMDDPENMEVETSADETEYVPGELVVLREGAPEENNIEVVPIPEAQTLRTLEQEADTLEGELAGVEAVEPNYVRRLDARPNDPQYGNQYHLPQIGAPTAWDYTKGSGVRICIIDSGYDRANPEFDNVVAERDFLENDNVAQSSNGHGTHVAGIAAAKTDNGIRTAGVAWSSGLVIAKIFNSAGSTSSALSARAINYCHSTAGVSIINMSYSDTQPSAAERAEIVESWEIFRHTLVAAAGNSYDFQTNYPSAYPYVIGVGATNANGSLADYSTKGTHVDITAPGTNVLSSWPGSTVARLSGTSMAAPIVAGSAALLRDRGLTSEQVQSRLFNQSEDRGAPGKDPYWGHGFLNVKCAAVTTETGCPPGS